VDPLSFCVKSIDRDVGVSNVGDAQDPNNYVTNFRINKYSLSGLMFSEIVNLITSLIKTIDLLSW